MIIQRARESHKPKIDQSSRLRENVNEQLNIKEPQTVKGTIDDIQKQKLDTRFSLIVRHGSRQKEEQEIKDGVRVGTAQSHSYRLDESIKVPTVPVTTGIKLPGIEDITKPKKKPHTGKLKKGFYRWNTDTERVGVYLPTADLHTSRTEKVITKVDQLQRKTHTPKYQKTLQRKRDKIFSFDLEQPKQRINPPKTKIHTIFSKPKKKRDSRKVKFF